MGLKIPKWWRYSFSLIGLLISVTGQAMVVTNLYEVTLPCESQSSNERRVLFKEGLKQVLDKISVEPEMARYPIVEKALEHADDYVELYGYEANSIRIRFNAKAIQPLIRKTGQVTWGEQRPSVMVWLGIEEKGQRRLIGQETDPVLYTKLQKMAEQKGIPVILPLMDIEDINAVGVNDIWGQFTTVLQQGSQRYGAKVTLVGRLQCKDNGECQALWQWLSEKEPVRWEATKPSLDAALSDGFERMITQLKENYVAKNTSPSQAEGERQKPILIGISNVKSVEDFVLLENYLEGLSPITQVSLLQVLGDRAIFEVIPQANQNLQTLAQVIGLDQQLMSLGDQDPHFKEVDLVYHWVALGRSSGQ